MSILTCIVCPKIKILALCTHSCHSKPICSYYSTIKHKMSNFKESLCRFSCSDHVCQALKNTIKVHMTFKSLFTDSAAFQWSINLWTAVNRSLSHLVELSQSFLTTDHENQASSFLWTSWFWPYELNSIYWTDPVLKLFSLTSNS